MERHAWGWKSVKSRNETDVVRSDVTQKAASGSQSPNARIGLSEVSRVDIGWLDTSADLKFSSSADNFGEEHENSDTVRFGRNAGLRILPRHGGSKRQELGRNGFRSKCGG